MPFCVLIVILRIYGNYFGGGNGAELNRMEIRILDSSPFKNGINDYCFLPLCVDIYKEIKKSNLIKNKTFYYENTFNIKDETFENYAVTKKEFEVEWEKRKKEVGEEKLVEKINNFLKQYPELL